MSALLYMDKESGPAFLPSIRTWVTHQDFDDEPSASIAVLGSLQLAPGTAGKFCITQAMIFAGVYPGPTFAEQIELSEAGHPALDATKIALQLRRRICTL